MALSTPPNSLSVANLEVEALQIVKIGSALVGGFAGYVSVHHANPVSLALLGVTLTGAILADFVQRKHPKTVKKVVTVP